MRLRPVLLFALVLALSLGTSAADAQERTDPAAWPEEAPAGTLRLAFLADAQEEEDRTGLRELVALAHASGASRLLYGGDTNYHFRDAPPDWVEALAPYEDRTLFVFGNHDGGPGYQPFLPAIPNTTWWRWEDEGVVVLGLNTNRDLTNESPQLRWLDERLAEDRGRVVLLMLHIPWWVPPYEGSKLPFPGDAEGMRARVNDTPVAIVLGAHQHHYSRHDVDGIPHIITGPADAHMRGASEESTRDAIVEARARTIVLLDASRCGVAARVLTPDGAVLDEVERPHVPREEDAAALEAQGLRCVEGDARPSEIPPPPPPPSTPTPPVATATPTSVTPKQVTSPAPIVTPQENGTPAAGALLGTLALAAAAVATRRRR